MAVLCRLGGHFCCPCAKQISAVGDPLFLEIGFGGLGVVQKQRRIFYVISLGKYVSK